MIAKPCREKNVKIAFSGPKGMRHLTLKEKTNQGLRFKLFRNPFFPLLYQTSQAVTFSETE
jgi:hypothetical protein